MVILHIKATCKRFYLIHCSDLTSKLCRESTLSSLLLRLLTVKLLSFWSRILPRTICLIWLLNFLIIELFLAFLNILPNWLGTAPSS